MESMLTEFEVTRRTKASVSKAMDFYMHPENLPKLHPEYVKVVKILSADGDTITYEQQMEVMGKKLRAVNRMSRNRKERKLETETLEGDGKGSNITISLKEIPAGTEIQYKADMALGFFPMGFLETGSLIRRPEAFFEKVSQFLEKVADEDMKALDAL
jgi:hypothetical protein